MNASTLPPTTSTTLVILLGASAWPNSPGFQESLAFAHAAHGIKDYFLDPQGFSLPTTNLCDQFDGLASASEQLEILGSFLEERRQALKAANQVVRDVLVYFVGHGGFAGPSADFYLMHHRTNASSLRASGIAIDALAEVLLEKARQTRRYLVLDCCFAAAAFKAFQGGPDQTAITKTLDVFSVQTRGSGFPRKGTVLLCSSDHKTPSLLLPDESCTMFSHALLEVLKNGSLHRPSRLSLRDMKELAQDRLAALPETNVPRPGLYSPDQSEGDVADIPFFPNPRFEEEQTNRASAELERDTPHLSASPLGTTEAAMVPPGRPGKRYLFALLVGVLASLFSVFFTSVIFGGNASHFVLFPLPPLVMSLITGFLTGKRVVGRTAGLFVGLVVGAFWFVYILFAVMVSDTITDPSHWIMVGACAAMCGLLSWLVAWLARGTTEAATLLPSRPGERHLFTLLVGTLAGLFSVLFTSVIYVVNPTLNFFYDKRVSLALLPPLVMSLVTGFLIGKRMVGRTAGLFAGLVVGVSWFSYILTLFALHPFPFDGQGSEKWMAVIVCAAVCGPLSWLVAWLTTRTHPKYS